MAEEAARPASPEPHGFLNVEKPRGYTSHDVVAFVRRTIRVRRVGHAGTLDPAARGVLPICVGRATRLADEVGEGEKAYQGDVVLGIATTTDDAEGEVVAHGDTAGIDEATVRKALDGFVGPQEQIPPAFSAVRVQGMRAYQLARRGGAVELRPRQITIYEARLVAWHPPVATIFVRCSRGTYVRAIARDLGQRLGCGAHLDNLVRLAVGRFTLDDALALEEIALAAQHGYWTDLLFPPDFPLVHLPAAIVHDERAHDFRHGRAWRGPSARGGRHRVYGEGGSFLGVAEFDPTRGVWNPRLGFV
ncbi:MAG TPA: tRNA pseudouridine(55) synthase TruB [Chloroflexota bacterium]